VATGLGNGGKDGAREFGAVLERQGLQPALSAARLVVWDRAMGGGGSETHSARTTIPIPGVAFRSTARRRCRSTTKARQQQGVDVDVRQADEILQGQFSERGEQGRRKKIVQVIGAQLGSDVAEDQRADGERWWVVVVVHVHHSHR